MEIFGIGLGELLIIAVVALVILGPDRLPEAFRALGKGVADFRRALEPARNAWAEVTRELNSVGASEARSSAAAAAAAAAAAEAPKGTTGNPWDVHPLAEGLSDEERDRFFRTGELPEWRLHEMDRYELSAVGSEDGAEPGELADLDYPMPHGTLTDSPAPPFEEEQEALFYPPPSTINKEASTE